MSKENRLSIDALVRRIYRFDTQHEAASFVSCMDADASLREAVQGRFYRLSVELEHVPHCVIFHDLTLGDEHQQAIERYAKESGGETVSDDKTRDVLTLYAFKRYMAVEGPIRWDSPLPRTN